MIKTVAEAKRKLASMNIVVEKSKNEEFSWYIQDIEFFGDDDCQENGVHLSDLDLINLSNEFFYE